MSGNGHGVCDFYCVSPLSASGAELSFSIMAKIFPISDGNVVMVIVTICRNEKSLGAEFVVPFSSHSNSLVTSCQFYLVKTLLFE